MEFSIERSIELLQRTPAVLRSLLEGLSDDWTMVNEGGESWNAYQVAAHLAYTETATWLGRAEPILRSDGDRKLPTVDATAQIRESKGKSLSQVLDDFARMRAESIDKLRALQLDESTLQRTGEHPAFGTVTLSQLLATWAVHDLNHLAQIARVMARQYAEAIGPWTAYLRIMEPISKQD